MFQSILITAALGYFIGCFQSAYLLIRWIKKQDIREHGFGNAGASNTVSSFGWRLGIVVALLDILKPILSIILLKQMIAWGWVNDYPFLVMFNGFFVILGHNYPFYLNFKGGKGTASLIGLMIAIHPLYSLFGLILFVISALVSNYIVMGTVALLVYFIGISLYLKMGTVAVLFAVLIAAQSLYLHLPNFKRIANKTETKITSKLKK
ncbi:MAG: glycerol-3-phosphate acyltransferase [Peptostreptococcaceae bacterium]|nr:glycerol-3-phosphate acyltransferase [Peptostreptococcaceae bacterium]